MQERRESRPGRVSGRDSRRSYNRFTPPLVAYLSAHLGKTAPAHYVALTCVVGVLVALSSMRRGPAAHVGAT